MRSVCLKQLWSIPASTAIRNKAKALLTLNGSHRSSPLELIADLRNSQPWVLTQIRNFQGKASYYAPSQKERNGRIQTTGKRKDWKTLLRIFDEEGHDFDLVNYSTTLSQLAKIPNVPTDHPSLQRLALGVAGYLDKCTIDARSFSNILHSIAKLQIRNEAASRIVDRLSNPNNTKDFLRICNGHDLGNVAWSLTQMDRPDLMRIIVTYLEEIPLEFLFQKTTQPVANIAWACAVLNQDPPSLFSEIEARADWIVSDGNSQNISNTAWACATLGHSSPSLFVAIEKRCDWLVSNGNTQDVANTAWACGKLGHSSPALFEAIERRCDLITSNCNARAASAISWASATLGHRLPNFFQSIVSRANELDQGEDRHAFRTSLSMASKKFGFHNPLSSREPNH